MAMGVIDAAVHTIIIRKVTAPALFDETPVGLRRRRTMAEGMERLEALAAAGKFDTSAALLLDVMAVIVALDYLDFRFTQVPWLRPMPSLRAVAATLSERPAVALTCPH
jgi:glutathione S-transferase